MTIRAGVIGHPVAHSLSPAMHNAAYKETGLDWVYDSVDIEPADADMKIRSLLENGYKGLNVTMPHKKVAFDLCDEVHESAQRIKSVNTMVLDDQGKLNGYSTDGQGFLNGLISNNVEVAGERILVIGAGRAARSICDQLYVSGAEILLAARNEQSAHELCQDVISGPKSEGTISAVQYSERNTKAGECSIIVNATPIGMEGTPTSNELPLDADFIMGTHIVVDAIYYPQETPLIIAAKAIGAKTINGIPMLLNQGALAFKLMTGIDAPIDVMHSALIQAIEMA